MAPAVLAARALEAEVFSDPGTARPDNQDFAHQEAVGDSGVLVVVADGISGQLGGATASRMAVETTFRSFKDQPPGLPPGKRLWRAVQQANIDVYDFALVVTELRGMGTTLTAIVVDGGEVAAAHAGDSRLYLIRNGAITQLTKDHTVTGDMVRMGVLGERRARHHPDRSTLTRCLGRELIVGLDRFTRKVLQGDIFVLCTDGLYNTLEDSEIVRIVSDCNGASCCRTLVDAANQLGTQDNVTAAVVRVVGPVPEPMPRRRLLTNRVFAPLRRVVRTLIDR